MCSDLPARIPSAYLTASALVRYFGRLFVYESANVQQCVHAKVIIKVKLRKLDSLTRRKWQGRQNYKKERSTESREI